MDEAAVEALFREQAKGLYPTFTPHLDAGLHTRDVLEPYRQVAKQVLGEHVEPNFIGDPKWTRALEGHVDPKTGTSSPMSLSEWRTHLMQNDEYGWGKTQQAHDAVHRILTMIHDGFGGNEPRKQ